MIFAKYFQQGKRETIFQTKENANHGESEI